MLEINKTQINSDTSPFHNKDVRNYGGKHDTNRQCDLNFFFCCFHVWMTHRKYRNHVKAWRYGLTSDTKTTGAHHQTNLLTNGADRRCSGYLRRYYISWMWWEWITVNREGLGRKQSWYICNNLTNYLQRSTLSISRTNAIEMRNKSAPPPPPTHTHTHRPAPHCPLTNDCKCFPVDHRACIVWDRPNTDWVLGSNPVNNLDTFMYRVLHLILSREITFLFIIVQKCFG
jgi:hypothetical protein